MSSVLEEVTDDTGSVDRERVERRVEDWAKRISELFSEVKKWLPEGFVAHEGRGERLMNEPLMEKFEVGARALPVLHIQKDGREIAKLEPRGLWIIGANGRVDLVGSNGHFLIVDKADSFEKAEWSISPLANRKKQKPLLQDSFVKALLG